MRNRFKSSIGKTGAVALLLAVLAAPAILGSTAALAQTAGREVSESEALSGGVPGQALGATSDAEFWRAIRQGMQGTVSIPNRQAGVLIQSEGDNWRAIRNGPMTVYGAWAMLATIGILALFFVVRGRIRIDAGPSGRTVVRFNELERFTHWMTAVSFILLGLTGLNMLYGKHVLMPAIGQTAFAAITHWGKYVHNFVSFAFMAGIVLMFLLWVRHNIPNRDDLTWLSKAGGLFTKNVHPPSRKFNAGQKIIFWLVVLGGLSLAMSGVALLFPFEISWWAPTFKALNSFGFNLPTDLKPIQEMQISQLWHAAMGLVMIAVIIGHIYIGTLGMEGAFDAMGTGRVDENWAREHHNLWVAEVTGEAPKGHQPGKTLPAE